MSEEIFRPKVPVTPPVEVKMRSETIENDPPAPGGTLIIMQRHGNYDRKTGHLTPEGEVNALERSRRIISEMLAEIPPAERDRVKIFVVASPTKKNEGQRSMETAAAAIKSVQEVFEKMGIPKENLLHETPRPARHIEEPRVLRGDESGFLQKLIATHGELTREFWEFYENDVYKEERERAGVEGPVDMSDRFARFTNVLARYARLFHSRHTEAPERLIIWNVSHYDTVTTFFKNHVANIPQTTYIPVDYDGGMSLMIKPEGEASITLQGATYPVELSKRGAVPARVKREKEAKSSTLAT